MSPEIDVYGMLSVSLDGFRDELRAYRDEAARARPPQPIERDLYNAAAFPSSGVLALNMGGPQQGRVWRVRSIAVGGVTPTTTEAGRADIFVAETAAQVLAGAPAAGSQPGHGGFTFNTGLAAGSTGRWRDQTTTLPNVAFYSRSEMTVKAGQLLFIVFSNGTSTDLLVANVFLEDFETAAYPITREA